MTRQLPDFVVVGYVEKAHGVKGELRVKALTDHPPRFNDLQYLQTELRNGSVQEHEIESVLVRQDCVYLKLANINRREQAEALKGALLSIKRDEVLPLSGNDFYYYEVLDFVVETNDGRALGRIREVYDYPANAVLSVIAAGNREVLIPVIPSVIEKVDRENCRIIINPIDGLFD